MDNKDVESVNNDVFKSIDEESLADDRNERDIKEPVLITTFGASMCSGDRDGAC